MFIYAGFRVSYWEGRPGDDEPTESPKKISGWGEKKKPSM